MNNNLFYYQIRKISLFIIVLSSLNYILTDLGYNFIDFFGFFINKSYLNIILFTAGVIILSDRNTWLPFLEESILPCSVINKQPPTDATLDITIKTTPNTKIVYWASNPSNIELDVDKAYGDFSNSGTTISDENGNAICKIRPPSGYKLPNGSSLSPHLHYRECPTQNDINGMLGAVKTIYIK